MKLNYWERMAETDVYLIQHKVRKVLTYALF